MSYIIGGGGGGGGLTEAEVTTLIGRGVSNGTAALDAGRNLRVPGNRAYFGSTPATFSLLASDDEALRISRMSNKIYKMSTLSGVTRNTLLDASDRNGATSTGVAAIYNPCKTIFNEHRPVCTKEYHLTGKYLDGADNPDVWFPIKGAGTGASVAYLNRELKLNCGSGMISASRCVIDQTKFPITGNFLEVTAEIGSLDVGEGGSRKAVIGFQPAFSSYIDDVRAAFVIWDDGTSRIGYTGGRLGLPALPIGRDLRAGDIVTVRLDREEGSPDINICRYYINGQKQYETTSIPTANVYAGVGVFASNTLVDVGMQLGIKYFGVKYVP